MEALQGSSSVVDTIMCMGRIHPYTFCGLGVGQCACEQQQV